MMDYSGEHPGSGAVLAAGVADSPLIVIDHLCYSATDRRGREVKILDDLCLEVNAGEFVAIVGPSGCGKSTALNFMAGLVTGQQSGTVRVSGQDVHGITPGVGYMFQTHGLFPWRTIIQNVELALELQGVSRAGRAATARRLLGELGLNGFENHYPAELSGGMRQRVSLARTLANNPGVLLMDEPFGALDAQTKLLVQDGFVAYWKAHRKTVVFVTHDLGEAIFLADRIIVMSARPGRIKKQYKVPFARPRHLAAIRADSAFGDMWERIWLDLKEEAQHSKQGIPNG